MVLPVIRSKFVCAVLVWFFIFSSASFNRISSVNRSSSRGHFSYSELSSTNSTSCTTHLSELSQENRRLQQELEFFMLKNQELQAHMNSLYDQCGNNLHCEYGDASYSNDDVWYPDPCSTCRCENGNVNCYASHHSENCNLHCTDNTCLNGGTCHIGQSLNSVQCSCPDGFSGPLCEQVVNSCTPIRIGGECDHSQTLWYFDSYSNLCKSTNRECFDPRSTFSTFESCSLTCLQGTCCYRMKIGEVSDAICQAETMQNCQALCQEGQVEVLGYYPGIKCPKEGCAIIASKICHTGVALYSPGSKFSFGCDVCECLDKYIQCSCSSLSLRKEIRDLSYHERIQYQKAVAQLQKGGDKSVWTSLRNMYVTHIMHANSPLYFLFWNRNFLRTMERHLQEVDCSITIPYFDFTLDAGDLASSAVWHDDIFGSQKGNTTFCQQHAIPNSNIFWTPCIRREITKKNNVPTMVDIAMVLAKSDFNEFTKAVQGISAYLHSFIGGDMETKSSPHDPIFYSLHAYIDLLFWKWQKRHSSGDFETYSSKVLHANLIPFNTEQQFLIDSEKILCVSYKSIGSKDEYPEVRNDFRNYDYGASFIDENMDFSSTPCESSEPQFSHSCEDMHMKAILNAGHKIQSVLYTQEENFLKTLPRTCLPPHEISNTYINQAWNVQPVDFKVLSNYQHVDLQTDWCKRFCFTADIFLPPEPTEVQENACSSNQVPICEESALLKCPYYTYTPCRLSLCGNCSLICHVNEQDIECNDSKIDFCSPNPCKNGGICKHSEWPTMPHLISCNCAPGFEGELCEHVSSQRCYLPRNIGEAVDGCGNPEKRWYFDARNQDCYSFYYHGCLGNANNFASYYECRVSCIIGACCWRMPLHPERVPGYNEDGYDRYGFNSAGKTLKNEIRTFENGYGGSMGIFRFNGLDFQGYDEKGYNKKGLDRFGYNREGYHHLTKVNRTGYDTFGDHDGIIDFDELGYDSDRYDRSGLNCFGYSKSGWDYYGLSTGWSFECRAMNLKDCQNTEKEYPHLNREVISFSPGKKCEEVQCDQLCGCNFLQKSYPVGSQFPLGCGTCKCSLSRRITCSCTTTSIRKEVRDMTSEELKRYQNAIKTLALQESPSTWQNITYFYRHSLPHSRGGPLFLPWHRFFLRYMEMKLQEIDCSVTIPYFDWTMDVGSFERSVVWQANYFGGNGDSENDNCVKSHPFKNYHPIYWQNCLKREFNSSIYLPNVVDLEKILRYESFEELSSQLDVISGLFHLFVGGHMATPDAAYDPIFFSHYAFIDKIWYEWVVNNPNNILKFPHDFRYTPLIPFGVVPDDVLLSMTQLCVSYLPVTKGAPCVSSISSSSKFLDVPGINKMKLFNSGGYDTEGYDSSGYDRMGWNRKGYFRDKFNRDGFDIDGFDRQGYNRYGFDRSGCNSHGFCYFSPSPDPNVIKKHSPWEEYNEMGLQQSGLDFHGHDIYGFDANGFDRDNCSYFFHGPFYPLFMKNTKEKLRSLNYDELQKIKRTCPSMSTLPPWWLNTYWLNREIESGRSYSDTVFVSELEENIFNPFSGTKDIWLAPVPEENFCFQLQHHTKCELHRSPVPCPFQKCSSPFCATLPSARCRDFGCGSCDENFLDIPSQNPTNCYHKDCASMDGTIRKDGDVWEEELCYSCSCAVGIVSCSPVQCDTPCDHPILLPGSCCPVCDGCMANDILYRNAETFIDPQNPCLKCICQNGSILCSAVDCDIIRPCRQNAVQILPGQCCPKCSMCGPHREGSHWMESPCHNCTCEGGSVHCSVIDCALPTCQYPARAVGECCRHCDDCEYNGSFVKNGEIFNPGNCQECLCQKGNVMCKKVDCSHSKCHVPDFLNNSCCQLCHQGCQYDGKEYKDGSVFTPSFNPCLNCSCQRTIVRCQPVKCPESAAACNFPVFLPGGCCPQCPKCQYQNKEYFNGDRWRSSNDTCKTCACLDGKVKCSEQEFCSSKKCTHGVVPDGECCSPCVDCKYSSHIVLDQMQFSPPEDPCARCICQKGNITCVRETCPKLLCRATELPAGACCPVCKGCTNSLGQPVEHGQKWIHSSDICQVCSCQDGISKCERIACETICTHPVMRPDHCCPECNGCQVLGRIYQNNAEIPSNEKCRRCFCFNGNMECESVRCPTVTCDNPLIETGECCPTCKQCNFQGLTYEDGEVFQPKSDSCYSCSCNKGAVQCERRDRCNPQCSDPIKLPNQCCPVCDGCEYEGRELKNREVFIPNPQEPCLNCECVNGNVKCFQQQCPKLNCINPIKPLGQCCEECSPYCSDEKGESTLHSEGDIWIPEEDTCKICMCKDSRISCKPVDCQVPMCLHAAAPFGVCCRECEHCEFTHRLYRNGQEFTHEDDPCQICKCENGTVSCETVHCDPLPCMHPEDLTGLCCPICAPEVTCNYLGKTYQAWENFMDPENSCSECVCLDGMVSCHQVLCMNTECPNPQLGHCCESCDGCSYGEKNYLNHVSFHDPYNLCRECECESGVVSCQQKSCESSPCKNPLMMEGECCPMCQDCIYKEEFYSNGEHFFDPDDPCVECYCQFPDVYCQLYNCAERDCNDLLSAKCCESCSDCSFYGESYEDGSSFIHPENPCELCSCEVGEVICYEKPCPDLYCTHPVDKECCSVCNDGCLFDDKFYEESQTFPDPYNPCQECSCWKGDVTCKKTLCPAANCTNPSTYGCCPECSDCFYKNELIENNHSIDNDGSDNCKVCSCVDGNVDCKPKFCPIVYCSDPVIHNCCPVCNMGCLYDGNFYKLGEEFDHPKDPCSECACMDGTVHCDRKPCDPVNCLHPIEDPGECCAYCPDYCLYQGQKHKTGSVFAHESDLCQECTCQEGDIFCDVKTCPSIQCLHPAPGDCCLECSKCQFHEKIYSDGKNFTNPNNSCETCLCSKGQVACRKNSCVQCLHPIVKEYECCPLCDGCFYAGMNYTNQERFIPPGNPCEECICKNGTVTCHKLSCSLPLCSNPVLEPGVCCPTCPGCTFSGANFEENEEFTHPGNPCEKCICKDGLVACKKILCQRNCTHPTPDPCCPMCNDCMFETVKYFNGKVFNPDPCRTCECRDGNVLCISEFCPQLSCQLRTRVPGQCCETCRGCVYEGIEYENNATWYSSTNPCLACKCSGGTVSCTNVLCPVECVDPIPVPGLCCPVCPDCEKDGIRYKSGEKFSPPDRPCDSCRCDSGNVFCIRHECPVLIGCPEESIKPPGKGECCPTCAGYGTSCTRDQIGQLVYPSPDPCFVCQCSKDFMWVCSKEFCPHLNCPTDEVIKSEKECCPKCKVCISEGLEIHLHGDSWSLPNDPCSRCVCDFGYVKCSKLTCPEIICETGEFEFRVPGECCPICTSSKSLACDYGGTYYENGENWSPDPCTTCQCVRGKMTCHNERCLPLQCTSDEIPSVDPGQCCPKCIPRPATCIAFGDPHYRTFDGAAVSFQGTCRYILTADCSTQKFSVIVENNDRGFNGVSWTHRVVVVLQNASVDLRAGPSVYVRGKHIDHLPYFENPVLYVEKNGRSVLVTTDVGVKVLWNGDGYVEVIVSGVYREKTCGLCGNFNNFPEDDMRTPTNQIVTSEAKFGNSWKNFGAQPDGCEDSVDIDPCSKGGYRIRKMANSKCSILKQSLFASCHIFIPPEPYFAACVYDVCACSENDDCLCDILSAYSQECAKAGVVLNWRSEGLCGIDCSEKEGFVFDECGPPCPRTCENRNLPIGILAAQCFKPCVPGCQCSADKVLHNGQCIVPESCP